MLLTKLRTHQTLHEYYRSPCKLPNSHSILNHTSQGLQRTLKSAYLYILDEQPTVHLDSVAETQMKKRITVEFIENFLIVWDEYESSELYKMGY